MVVNTQTAVTTSVEEIESLEAKLAKRTANVGIVGLGYVGLPLALLFADAGFPVTGFDIDPRKVESLNSWRVLYLPCTGHGNPTGAREELSSHRRLLENRRHGCRHHLRSDAAQRATRARPQLHYEYRGIPCSRICRRANLSCSKAPPTPAQPRKFSCRFWRKTRAVCVRIETARKAGAEAFTLRFRPSAKIRVTIPWHDAISPRSSADSAAGPAIWPPRSTSAFSSAPCGSPHRRPRK